MAKDLIIGSAGLQGFEEPIGRFLTARKREDQLAPWLEAPDTIVEISVLNGVAVLEFLRHSVGPARYSDETAAFKSGEEGNHIWNNLPWWDNALWLPVAFNNPGVMDDDRPSLSGVATA